MSQYAAWVTDQEPRKVGVFQRDILGIRLLNEKHYGYWNGKTWFATARSPHVAWQNFDNGVRSAYPKTRHYAGWRGLKVKP